MISFPEFTKKVWKTNLTPAQKLVSDELILQINADDNLLRFFCEVGSGTTTLLKLIESYYKRGRK